MYGNSPGVGDINNYICIDLCQSCFLKNGAQVDIGGLDSEQGTVVRSDDFGNKWYVDGQFVASTSDSDYVVKIAGCSGYQNHTTYFRPLITVKGNVTVSAIKYMK